MIAENLKLRMKSAENGGDSPNQSDTLKKKVSGVFRDSPNQQSVT